MTARVGISAASFTDWLRVSVLEVDVPWVFVPDPKLGAEYTRSVELTE
jgi:hypothetical protein